MITHKQLKTSMMHLSMKQKQFLETNMSKSYTFIWEKSAKATSKIYKCSFYDKADPIGVRINCSPKSKPVAKINE